MLLYSSLGDTSNRLVNVQKIHPSAPKHEKHFKRDMRTETTSTDLIHWIIQENPTHPSQVDWPTAHPEHAGQADPGACAARPARLASWEIRRASRDHADGFLSTGSCIGRITIPHAGPTTLQRSMTRWGELHQLPLLSFSPLSYSRRPLLLLSLSLFWGHVARLHRREGEVTESLFISPHCSPCRL